VDGCEQYGARFVHISRLYIPTTLDRHISGWLVALVLLCSFGGVIYQLANLLLDVCQSSSRATPSAFTLHAIYLKVLHFLSLSIDTYTHYIITITSLLHFERHLVNLLLSHQ
jgi:hypothetical protein